MHRILDKKKSLVICENVSKLNLVSEFLKINSSKKFLIFKEFETLPYDNFSPHIDNLSNRIETLSKADSEEITILTTTNALIQPLFSWPNLFSVFPARAYLKTIDSRLSNEDLQRNRGFP